MGRYYSRNMHNAFESQILSLATANTEIGRAATRTSTGNLGTAFNLRPSGHAAHTTELERIANLRMTAVTYKPVVR